MIACPKCKGEKVLRVTVHDAYGSYVEDLPCIHCDGSGEVTPIKAAEIAAADALWCHCDKPEHGGDHYTNPDIYCCRNCGGVLSTG